MVNKKQYIPAVAIAGAAALQIAIFEVARLFPAFRESTPAHILPGLAAGAIFLLLAERSRSGRGGSPWGRAYTWAGRVLWTPPALHAAFFLAMFVNMFGLKAVGVMAAGCAAGLLVTSGNSASAYILLATPFAILFKYYGIEPTYLWAGTLLAIAAAACLRHKRWRPSLALRVAAFTVWGAALFCGIWYASPRFSDTEAAGGDGTTRHVTPLEKAQRREVFPHAYYSVDEDCAGETLYLTNLFDAPGLIEWRRGARAAHAHNELKGITERLIFECPSGDIYAGEYKTGRLLKFHGGTKGAPARVLNTRIKSPARVTHRAGSGLFYFNGDEQSFPWYITDRDGRILKRFAIKGIEEIAPLADDSFVTAYDGRVHHMRFDPETGKIVRMGSAALPTRSKIEALRRFGPLFMHLALNERDNIVYISDFGTGYIYSVSLPALKTARIAKTEKGVRHISFSPKFNAIAAGNYLTGDLYILDTRGQIIYKKNIGSRLRGVTVSRDEERFYAVSRGGVFEIRLNAIKRR